MTWVPVVCIFVGVILGGVWTAVVAFHFWKIGRIQAWQETWRTSPEGTTVSDVVFSPEEPKPKAEEEQPLSRG